MSKAAVPPVDICILLPDLRGGGAERLHVNLANDWVARGLRVQLVLMSSRGDLHGILDPRVDIADLRSSRFRSLLIPLSRHLRAVGPAVTLAAMWPLTSVAIASWALAGRPGRLFVSDHTHLSIAAVRELGVPRWFLASTMRLTYPHASGVIAVSKGVKDDMMALAALDPAIIDVIHNPAAMGGPFSRGTPEDRALLWKRPGGKNILSVGTLKAQKDHATLISAFALLPARLDARLTILGEGALRAELEEQVRSLNLQGRVELAGFILDPYPWYRTADLFVLSSRWEGFGNVLVEALECGVPVVSTNCTSGPSEVLEDGRFGKLVPVQDPAAMAAAMSASLMERHDVEANRRRASDFSVNTISDRYLSRIEVKPGGARESAHEVPSSPRRRLFSHGDPFAESRHSVIEGLKRLAFAVLGSRLNVRYRLNKLRHGEFRVVLNLHRVSSVGGGPYEALDPRLFDDLLTFLQREFTLVTFGDEDGRGKDAGKPKAILSFDDGYKDFIETAVPILRRHRVRCNQNIIPACVESQRPPLNVLAQDFLNQAPPGVLQTLRLPGFDMEANPSTLGLRLSAFIKNRSHVEQQELADILLPQLFVWEGFRPTPMMDLQDLRQISGDHELGAHSYSHASMEYETDDYLVDDVRRCREYFDRNLGIPVNIYAFPNGSYAPGQLELVEQAGIEHVLLVGERLDTDPRRHARFTFHARTRSESRYRATGAFRSVDVPHAD
jgi:glycosyltransferase involved in cell wall biosynthesis/peptidoglycan/xylan/chitin deacetylase (PgdA/CDA1 family)